jgi:hypothetical protein
MKARREMAVKQGSFGNVQPSTRMTRRALGPAFLTLATAGVPAFLLGFGPSIESASAEGAAASSTSTTAASPSFACEVRGTPLMGKGASGETLSLLHWSDRLLGNRSVWSPRASLRPDG